MSFVKMSTDILISQFVDAVGDCRLNYVDRAIACVSSKPELDGQQRITWLDELEHRFDQLLIKVFVEVGWSDCVWSNNEGQLAKVLLETAFRTRVSDDELVDTLNKLYAINSQESWQSVLEPFMLLEELVDARPELEAAMMRMANIVAKIDGRVTEETIGQLKNIQWQIHQFLKLPREPDYSTPSNIADQVLGAIDAARSAVATQQQSELGIEDPTPQQATEADEAPAPVDPEQRKEQLAEALAELEQLVGIDEVKREVTTLVNFLKVQTARKQAGLPANELSLHMVFEGNPGTGKTTVARLLGRIFGAMGVLDKGHLVETDRSGLVAEFVGQTATKTNKLIDEALDGVLFIDEAYSLVGDAKDSFGAEAMQILLKRAEDDRDRLIVVLAGYREPMQKLLRSNPGLTSRFSRSFCFPDYSTEELCKIFDILAEKNHYQVPAEVRQALVRRLDTHVANKDEHFGNGRLVRNIFETAMRQLANRVVEVQELTPELLTTFTVEDLQA